ncbi:MAG: DnaJ domain-containing protein [Lachnospiraceae bacterium]|nr:DnaJ domain-containing protein [Lachnospiraceae bacterium]MBR4412655.1 DnaJ domain-containing protein [Lachnospiraceae bacterium]MBR5916830.1 DnaJ domain-containing protein [Lachnospiraceae bacterium]
MIKNEFESLFTILGLAPTNDLKAIRKAYSKMSAKYHPEENPEEWKKIHNAFKSLTEILNDEKGMEELAQIAFSEILDTSKEKNAYYHVKGQKAEELDKEADISIESFLSKDNYSFYRFWDDLEKSINEDDSEEAFWADILSIMPEEKEPEDKAEADRKRKERDDLEFFVGLVKKAYAEDPWLPDMTVLTLKSMNEFMTHPLYGEMLKNRKFLPMLIEALRGRYIENDLKKALLEDIVKAKEGSHDNSLDNFYEELKSVICEYNYKERRYRPTGTMIALSRAADRIKESRKK